MRVKDPRVFVNEVVGTQGIYISDAAEDYLRDVIVARLNDLLGENLTALFDLPAYYDELATGLKARVKEDFEKYGIELLDFFITAITPPEEVQKRLNELAGHKLLDKVDLGRFTAFKTAEAIGDAAKQPGGAAADGMGMGMGAGFGFMMPGILHSDSPVVDRRNRMQGWIRASGRRLGARDNDMGARGRGRVAKIGTTARFSA